MRQNGWLPDKPDHRDLYYKALRPQNKLLKAVTRPKSVDLRGPHFPAIFNQGQIGSCVANATAAACAYAISVEDFDKEGYEPEVLSRLFIYYNARGGVPQDQGTYIREAMKSLSRYGACLETPYWPYVESKWAERPTNDAYAEAAHREVGVSYYRVDNHTDRLDCLAQGFPIVFGAMIFTSFQRITKIRNIVPLPRKYDSPQGGHAMLIVGYDDKRKSYLVRNSWGADWGDEGHCWFPYKYLDDPNLADDFWTVRKIAR